MSQINHVLLILCYILSPNEYETTTKITWNYFKGKYDRRKEKPRIQIKKVKQEMISFKK